MIQREQLFYLRTAEERNQEFLAEIEKQRQQREDEREKLQKEDDSAEAKG